MELHHYKTTASSDSGSNHMLQIHLALKRSRLAFVENTAGLQGTLYLHT